MRIRDIFRSARDIPVAETSCLAALALSVRKEDILAGQDVELDTATTEHLETLIEERRKGKPLAYIVGEKEFFSLPFFVDKRVLIPRPETETLVEEALSVLQRRRHPVAILDMGTGSGAIGLTVAKRTGRTVVCVDSSAAALAVARENARRLETEERTIFLCSDLFGGLREGLMFDLILANLPYVAESAWPNLEKGVREYEPSEALRGGRDGLAVYRRLAAQLKGRLAPEGTVICEIDGPEQAEGLAALLDSRGLSVATKQDYSQRERIVIGHG